MNSKQIPIHIEVNADDDTACSRSCPFLKWDDYCMLFNEDLEEYQLPPGRIWNDCSPWRVRSQYCTFGE